jgi:hypothetical protein
MIAAKFKLISAVTAFCFSLLVCGSAMTTSLAWGGKHPPVLKPHFTDTCTQSHKDALLVAHGNMAKMLDDALNGVSQEFQSMEYKESFGPSSMDRDFTVLARLLLLRIGAATITITANCVPKGTDRTCNLGVWAYVAKQKIGTVGKKYVINFCPSYFTATPKLVKSISSWDKVSIMQGGVFLHELTHFAWSTKSLLEKVGMPPASNVKDQLGTVDEEYDMAGVKDLARTDPASAILNADSYHIFVMRLAVRKGTIYK